MNKYLFILGLVGTALFTACSSADDLLAENPNETLPDEKNKEAAIVVEAGMDSDVPITLGVGQSRGFTRAVLNPSDNNGTFSTEADKYLGVFCLATETQSGVSNIPSVISDNKWNTAAVDDEAHLIVRLRNVPAKVVRREVTPSSGVYTSDVTFWDITNSRVQHYYYPMGNWMKYNFYAYYPRQEETVNIGGDDKTTLAFTANQVLEKYYEIDGTQDIIWGMSDQKNATSVAASGADPYCAKYFRLARENEGGGDISSYYPKFTFEHKLVQYRFFVKAAKATDDPDDHTILNKITALNMQVTDMSIANAIYRLSLIVANKTPNADTKNGQLSMMGNLMTKEMGVKTYNADTDRFDQDGNGNLDHPFTITKDDAASTLTYTAAEAAAYNATLAGALPSGVALTDEQATAYNTAMSASKSAGDTLTADEAKGFNAKLPGAKAEGDDSPVGYILLARPEVSGDANFKYQLTVKVKYTTADSVDHENEVTIDLNPPAGGFEEGKIYNVIVNVQSPEEIFATAVLQEWETYEDADHHPYIEYGND